MEQLNEEFDRNGNINLKAIAEHPRIEGKRVDLSIVDSENLSSPYLIEFKYQYSGDFGKHKRIGKLIEEDLNSRGSDLFILIILDFDPGKKIKFDEVWGINNGVSKYLSKTNDWNENLEKSLLGYPKKIDVKEINHVVAIDKVEYNYKIIAISK